MDPGNAIATRPCRLKRRFFMCLGFLSLLLLLALIVRQLRVPVFYGLRLEAEAGAELYVGDHLVGVGSAEVPWAKLFGWNRGLPLGIVLPPNAQVVPTGAQVQGLDFSSPEFLGDATAERLGGEGATVICVSAGNPPWHSYAGRHRFARKEILLRRPDGILDQVFCLDAELTDVFGKRCRALVPIRVRPTGAHEVRYFTSAARGGDAPRFGNSILSADVGWYFEAGNPPEELAAEVRQKGLWSPPR